MISSQCTSKHTLGILPKVPDGTSALGERKRSRRYDNRVRAGRRHPSAPALPA